MPLAQRIPVYLSLALVMGTSVAFVQLADLADSRTVTLALAGLLGLAGLVFTALDSLGFLCVILAFFPFTSGIFRFEFGIVTFSPYSAGLILLAVQSAFLVLVRAKAYAMHSFDSWLLLLCMVFMASTLTSPDVVNTGFLAFHTLFLPTLAYFILRVQADSPERYRACIGFYLAGITCFNALYLGQAIYHQERLTLLNVPPVSVATLALPTALYLLYTGRTKLWAHRFAILVCLSSLLLSLSRIYILSLALSPLFMRAIRRGHARSLLAWTMALSLAVTLGMAALAPDMEVRTARDLGVAAGIDAEYRSDEGGLARLVSPTHWAKALMLRAVVFRITMKSFLEHPIMGAGTRRANILVTPHNIHMEWLEIGGVIGYLAYLALLLCHFGRFQGQATHDPDQAAHLLVVYVILVNSLTNGFMHGYFSNVAFTVFGFAYSLEQANRSAPSPREALP